MELNIHDFVELRNIVYRKSGIYLDDGKLLFLKRRVNQRVEDLGLSSVSDYLKFLKIFDNRGIEIQKLINLITINETYFFREFAQLRVFGEACLPEAAEKKEKIRILSAGSSTGEEAYTLSIIGLEMLPQGYDFEIFGIDIDKAALEKAKKGIYEDRAVKDVPKTYLKKYFEKISEGYYIKKTPRKKVKFLHLNLKNNRDLIELERFDFIFCRNVLMYFPMEDRRRIVENFYFALNPGGYIFLGASEFLSRITQAFIMRKIDGIHVYMKPEG
ncbi:MAG: methyltransferase [Kosmotoga sp.]|uniref:CheR family methyltransferase n=1 Tax=Kosmotoga sp. TaxID=1955248 RepID=UPI0025BCEAB2|nr:CheR family methyltransferase [Kosmotoga sp.]MCD6159853.1 methyltransferase [Kosmotoga sp.]